MTEKGHINPETYGHFSEHLGRCIYNGIYVGEDSSIPNTKGIRNDIVEAFKNIKMPVLRWPGGCFADEYHSGGRDRRKVTAQEDDKYPLGRSDGGQQLRHARILRFLRDGRL